MKKKLILAIVLFVVSMSSANSAPAQITITIPKIPKIKKDKPVQVKTDSSPTNDGQTADGQETKSKPSGADDKCSGSIWLDTHIEEINKRQQEVESFTPDRGWFVRSFTYDHLLNAVSPAAKEKWLTDSKALDFKNCPKLVAAFDKLAASAAKQLPLYVPNTRAYGFHNAAEENLMKGKINDLADHKIHYVGIQEASWLIDKNEFGIPKSRYKHGMAWVRYVPNDHPYCRIYYINIIQDYAGGGTYGASYGYFVKDELAGCPANAR